MSVRREREATGSIRTLRIQAIAVRPYRRAVRDKVFDLLERVACFVRDEDVIPAGTSDAHAVARVLAARERVLVVPFHAHRDANGQMLDGMSFVRALADASQHRFRWQIIMPVTGQGAAGLELARSGSTQLLDPEVERSLLTLDGAALENPATEARLERFLRGGV